MIVRIAGNHSRYHHGCKQVYRCLCKQIRDSGHAVYDGVGKVDALIVNGEGSMHHNSSTFQRKMKLLRRFQKLGIPTYLINTVWDTNPPTKRILRTLSRTKYISVREILSQTELANTYRIHADIHIDLSYWSEFKERKYDQQYGLAIGNLRQNKPGIEGDVRINIKRDSWGKMIGILRNCEIFVTARFHEVHAACKARCPFVSIGGSSHKINGLLRYADVDIPVLPAMASRMEIQKQIDIIKSRKDQFEKLFDFMEACEPLDVGKMLASADMCSDQSSSSTEQT